MESWYKKLWTLIGGRPWTFIYRDIWHKYEYLIQAQWFFIGLIVFLLTNGWGGVLFFWIVYTLGYINGHFFWGTRYIPNQKGK